MPPWSDSISQSALTVTSATTKGFRNEVKTIGAVAVSPLGGFRQRSVLGPAVRVKYSIHSGSENVEGKFKVLNEEPQGGIVRTVCAKVFQIRDDCLMSVLLAVELCLSRCKCRSCMEIPA